MIYSVFVSAERGTSRAPEPWGAVASHRKVRRKGKNAGGKEGENATKPAVNEHLLMKKWLGEEGKGGRDEEKG